MTIHTPIPSRTGGIPALVAVGLLVSLLALPAAAPRTALRGVRARP